MEALKLKIFDLLTKKITVSEFEKWLYNSESLLHQINDNSLVYDLVVLNYKQENWLNSMKRTLYKHFNSEEFMMFLSMSIYSELFNSKATKEKYTILKEFMSYFNNNYDSQIQFQLYLLWCDYDLHDIGIYDEVEFNHIVMYTSEDVLTRFNSCENLEEKYTYLNQNNTNSNIYYEAKKIKNRTLKQKLFAFLKKS